MQRASPVGPDPGGRGRRRFGVALGAVAGLALLLAFLSLNRLPPSEQRVTDQALDAVADLARALDEGDVGAVKSLLAPEWAVLDLPGSMQQILPPGDPADRLRFYTKTVDLSLAACDARPARRPVTRLVHCDFVLGGDLPAAIGLGRLGKMIVGVNGDQIVSVFQRSNPIDEDGALHYCIWSEGQQAQPAFDAFDINCRPTGSAPVHNRLAARYADAGSPRAAAEDLESRVSVGVARAVETFQHRPESLATIFDIDGPLVRYPGLVPIEVRWPFPAVPEFLAWSSQVYDVELGDCGIGARLQSGGYRIECAQARWGGALVTNLGLEPIEQPVSFFVEDGSITGVVGATSEVLDTAVATFCRWASTNRADEAATAFRSDCVPHYTPEGASQIIALAEDYASQD